MLFDKLYDIPADNVISIQPTATYKCSAKARCTQTNMTHTSYAMRTDKGKCSALLTREGFFDFVIFRTECNVSHNVMVVCQHDHRAKFSNSMSDIKVLRIDGFYSLQVTSSCNTGWFLVNNVCINFTYCYYACPNNTSAQMNCEIFGGQLAYHVLKNVKVTSPGNLLDNNTELSLFFEMFHHIEDLNHTTRDGKFNNPYHKEIKIGREDTIAFAVNGSDLCTSVNMSNQCTAGDIALIVRASLLRGPGGFSESFSAFQTDFLWSVIHQPYFDITYGRDMALCEKTFTHTVVFSNCSDLYMNCSDGTCVHDSLVCDGQQHCLHGEDEANCQHIGSDHTHSCISHCHHKDLCSCSPEYFQCLAGGCVPLQKLCDKIVHCRDSSDEPSTCVYLRPEQLGSPSLYLDINQYINMLIQQNMEIQHSCLQSHSGLLPPVHHVEYKMHSQQLICSESISPSAGIYFLFPCSIVLMQHSTTPPHYFSLNHLCIYDPNYCKYDHISHCLDGFHLLKCEHMYCVGRFKCPSSYCISFEFICNKICDCPHCEDESICSELLCPGMVLVEQMGSGFRCSDNGAALKNSMNRRQVIHRKGINITDDFPVFIHLVGVENLTHFIITPEVVVYSEIVHSNFSVTDVSVLHRMFSIHRLLLPHNSIQEVYDSMFATMSQLILLDLSHNTIKYLHHITLCSLHNLQYMFLHHNLIAEIRISIFVNNPGLQLLLLESNDMSPLSVIIDGFLPSLYRLSSDIPRLCCAFEAVALCSPPFPLFVSCSNSITSTALIVLSWVVGLSTFILGFLCLILLLYKFCTQSYQTPRAIMLFSINLNMAELVTSLCLLSYSIINVVFDGVFGVIADQWRHSWKCLGLEILFSMSSRASLAFAVCLSVHFAIHIPSIIPRKSGLKASIFQIIMSWLSVTSICTAVQILEYEHNSDPFNYFCFPFTTLFASNPLILGSQIAMLILDSLLLLATIVSYLYLLVFAIRRRRNKILQSVGKRREKLQKLAARLTLLILSTVLTWLPILCLQILVLVQITILPTIYLWCILGSLPVNLIIDPILLIRNNLK